MFSSSIDFTLFEDAVIGRGRIDNYLMEIPDRQGLSAVMGQILAVYNTSLTILSLLNDMQHPCAAA